MAQDAYSTKGLKGLKGLNKLKGLGGLSDEQRDNFYKAHEDILKNYSGDAYYIKANLLYSNQLFKDTFGQKAFDKYNNNDEESYKLRRQMLKSKLVHDAWVEYASPNYIVNSTGKKGRDNRRGLGVDYEKYSELSDDAKIKLMESGYVKPTDFENNWRKATARQRAASKKVSALYSPSGYNIGGLVNDATDINYGEAAKQKAREKNQQIIDKIYNEDIKDKKNADNVRNMVYDVYRTDYSKMSPTQVKKDFIKEITNGSYTNASGMKNLGVPELQSHYGNGSDAEVTQEMSKYSIDDMRQFLAKKKVYDQVFSPGMAQTMLNNEAKDYIYDHQSWGKRKWLQGKDFLIATTSYTADKLNGAYTLGLAAADALSKDKPQVYINEVGKIIDPSTKFTMGAKGALLYKDTDGETHTARKIEASRVALHNMGLNSDGSKDTSILNPEYWTKAEQYGTWDSAEQEKAAAIGSSPYQIPYGEDGEAGLAYESIKMMTFGLADQMAQLVPYGIGMTGRALSTASKVGKVVQNFGKALDWTGRALTAQTKAGQILQGTAGALGIANAYARGAFPETLEQNLTKLDEDTAAKSYNEVHQRYLTDKQYKAAVDQKIAARIAAVRNNYLIKQREGEKLPELNTAALYNQAQKDVIAEEIAANIQEKKSSQEYASMQEKAIQGAGNTAFTTFLPEAIKYGLVNTLGHMKWRYTNPASLQRKASSVYKGLSEITNAEGRKRLAQTTSKFLTNTAKLKELGKTAVGQIWGGVWTNGSDDMMVDAAQRINEDSYSRYLDAYRTGEALTDTYGFTDGAYSYWKGLNNSLGQATTGDAALVGGVGSILSFTPNFTNITSLATKAGRKAYKDAYRMVPSRDKDGNIVYHKADWNLRDKANFFLQNGILNSYYEKKTKEADNVEHANYVNSILDQYQDFEALEGLVAADIAGQNYTDFGDEKTGEFIKGLEAARALKTLATSSKDPSSLSSVIIKNKQLTAALAAYNKNPEKNPLPEEVKEELLTTYYAQNPSKVKSEAEDANAISIIAHNAKVMQDASDAYDAAEKDIVKLEKESKKTFTPQVRHLVKMHKALAGHWKERSEKMKSEIGDSSSTASTATGDALIASVGGRENAEELSIVYKHQEAEYNKQLKEQQEKTAKAKQEVDELTKQWEEAYKTGSSIDRVDIEEKYKEASKKYEDAQAQENYLSALHANTIERREAIDAALKDATVITSQSKELEVIQAKIDKTKESLEALKTKDGKLKKGTNSQKVALEKLLTKLEKQKQSLEQSASPVKDTVLTADEIFNLDAVSRARMLNPDNAHLYSEEQKREIDKLKKQLELKDPGALSKIQDIAKLQQRISTAEDAYSRLIEHPEGAAYNYEAQRTQAANSAVGLHNYKVADTNSNFIKEMVNFASELGLDKSQDSKYSPQKFTFDLLKRYNSDVLGEILKWDMLPEYTQSIKDAIEWGTTSSMLQSIIDNSNKNADWKKAMSTDIDNILSNSTNKESILASFEKAIEDIKSSTPEKAEDLRWLVKQFNDLELQKNAVKVENKSSKETTSPVESKATETTESSEAPIDASTWIPTEPTVEIDIDTDTDADTNTATEGNKEESKKENKEETNEEIPSDKEAKSDKQLETPQGENKESTSSETKDNTESPAKEEETTSTTETPESTKTSDIRVQDINGDIQARTPTVEELAEEAKEELPESLKNSVTVITEDSIDNADTTNTTGQQAVDMMTTTLSGNAMAEYNPTELVSQKKLVHQKGAREGDAMNQYYDWMKAAGVKLQNIIDHELSYILSKNPNAKVKFMAVKISQNATNDVAMQNHLMLVLDYDDTINKGITSIHNNDNGGVIESNGKKYLIIGTVGYGKQNKEKLAWYDILWNLYKPDGLNLKKQRKEWFDKHPNERFFVAENLSTEVVPGYPIPGYLVKQLEKDSSSPERSIVDLLKDPERNPYGLTLSQLGWGIQMRKGFVTMGTDKEVMAVKDPDGNMGRVFALVPASNGKVIPIYFKTKKYTEIQEGKLKEKIDALMDDIVSPQYNTRLNALKEMYKYLYLSPEGDNIILRKSRGEISLVSNGVELATFTLDNSFDRAAFKKAFADWNPRINVTLGTFRNESTIKEYAEAGALSTDIALLGTAGSSYMIYPLDTNGKMVKPVDIENPSTHTESQGGFRNGNRQQIIYNHNYYTVENDIFSLNGKVVTDPKTLQQLTALKTVLDKQLIPTKSEGVWNYFILESGENPQAVKINKNSKEVRELSREETKKIIEEAIQKKEKERREKLAEQSLKDIESIQEETPVNLNLEEDVTIDPETGEVITPEPSSENKELSLEVENTENTQESSSENTSEESVSPQVREILPSNHSAQDHPITQNFTTLMKNKTYRSRILLLVKKKWPQAGSKLSDIEKALAAHGIETNTIGTSKKAIEAWIKTIEDCR